MCKKTGCCGQLRLMLWKNWTLKKRRCKTTFYEIFIPFCILMCLVLIRLVVKVDHVNRDLHDNIKLRTSDDLERFIWDAACGTDFSDNNDLERRPFQGIALAGEDGTDGFIKELAAVLESKFLVAAKKMDADAYPNPVTCKIGCQRNASTPYTSKYPKCVRFNATQFVTTPNWFIRYEPFLPPNGLKKLNKYVSARYYSENAMHPPLIAAAAFRKADKDKGQFDYYLRMNGSDIPYTDLKTDKLNAGFSLKKWSKYFNAHGMTLKWLIDQQIIEKSAPSNNGKLYPSDAEFVPFPTPKGKKDNFHNYVQDIVGLFMVAAFMWPFSRMVRNMVEEKERKLKEGMKVMGMRNSVFWSSWAITYIVMFFILCLVFSLFGKLTVFKHSNITLIFYFMFIFSLSLVALALLVSSFFSRAKTAGTLSSFALLCGWLPYIGVAGEKRSSSSKGSACLSSPTAFSLGLVNILSLEGSFVGAQWDNTNEVVDNFELATALGLIFFDVILYFVLALYVDLVVPADFGVKYPWYFCCVGRYWKRLCGCEDAGDDRDPEQHDFPDDLSINATGSLNAGLLGSGASDTYEPPTGGGAVVNSGDIKLGMPGDEDPNARERALSYDVDYGEHVEAVPTSMRDLRGVKIRNLRKEFGSGDEKVVAVHDLSLDLYKGQIFVLLGHNGAGKTTTINMMTGMMPASDGDAHLYGRSISSEMHLCRKFMGICPQHDVLFDSLTVREHLEFFGSLKGLSGEQLEQDVRRSIAEVQLEEKEDTESCNLSGGQKRRLSLAIALMGDSRVVFLDEPTSGVDPFSRRAIWDLLTKKKQDRVIVLTTHFMDEADQLGDRIGILHKGRIKCLGSSLFLKRLYGVGYNLTVSKSSKEGQSAGAMGLVDNDDDQKESQSSSGDGETALSGPEQSRGIRRLIRQHVEHADLLSDVSAEMVFRLPLGESGKFPELLGGLDEHKQRLGIAYYGLSVTTMEEVFIKVATDAEVDLKKEAAEARGRSMSVEEREAEDARRSDLDMSALNADADHQYFSRHFGALFKKRYHIAKRDKKAFCCQFLTPLILIAVGLGILRIPPNFEYTKQFMNRGQYNQPNYVVHNQAVNSMITSNFNDAYGVLQPTMAGTYANFSTQVLGDRTKNKQSRYGAYYRDPTADADFLTVLTNTTGLHSMPAFLNWATDALLRGRTGSADAFINLTIFPFGLTWRQKNVVQNINAVFTAIVVSLGFVFIPASFAVFVVREREQKSKHLQLISGVSIPSYWLSSFLWDFIMYGLTAFSCSLLIVAYDNPNFVGENYPVLLTCFLFFGLSVIPFTYLLSFLFNSHSTAQNALIMLYLVAGVILTMVDFALEQIESTKDANQKYIRHLFRILPNFCLGDSIFWMSLRTFYNDGKWDMDIVGYDILFMAFESVIYFGATLAVEYYQTRPHQGGLCGSDPDIPADPHAEPLDVDVAEEQRQIQAGLREEDSILLKGLRKTYPPAKMAVDDLWFGVPAGQCFGFLGVNGAGKTTTLKMLTGDAVPSAGEAFLAQLNIATEPQAVRRKMGYCPQFDALHERLTARETLEFYGRLRGIPEERLNDMVEYLLDRLSLTDYQDRPAGTYSGGNKRKLSVGIALIGNPAIVFLDEPSTGMDPVSRRFMWNFISETMATRAVILTTHSMEECEALCSRIGILVQGQLKCLGTSAHLKHRFGKGFQIDISTGENDPERAKGFLLKQFPGIREVEVYGSHLKYSTQVLPNSNISQEDRARLEALTLRQIFEVIEAKKEEVGVADYSVGQTTLEQIFIHFAQAGEDRERAARHEREVAKYRSNTSHGTMVQAEGESASAGEYRPPTSYNPPSLAPGGDSKSGNGEGGSELGSGGVTPTSPLFDHGPVATASYARVDNQNNKKKKKGKSIPVSQSLLGDDGDEDSLL